MCFEKSFNIGSLAWFDFCMQVSRLLPIKLVFHMDFTYLNLPDSYMSVFCKILSYDKKKKILLIIATSSMCVSAHKI